jgi:hypothetical protein
MRAYCCQHLKGNFTVKFGPALDGLFWKIARAKRVEEYESVLQEINTVKQAAPIYLRAIDPQLWAAAYFSGNHYSHDMSNIV